MLKPIIFAMLFVGAMLPYWFTALTMKSVGVAAMEMVKEVKFQFATIPGLLVSEGHDAPCRQPVVMTRQLSFLHRKVLPAMEPLTTLDASRFPLTRR